MHESSLKSMGLYPRLALFLFGLLWMSLGLALIINANVGVQPWGTFHLGVAAVTGLSVGRVIQVVGLIVIVIGIALLRQIPGWGTFANMVLVGLMIDAFLAAPWLPSPTALPVQLVVLGLGLIIAGSGTAFYISASFGAGPRDGFMLGLSRVTGRPIATVRIMIEVVVLVVGYFLGGPVGLGTLITAFSMGPVVQETLRLTEILAKRRVDRAARPAS